MSEEIKDEIAEAIENETPDVEVPEVEEPVAEEVVEEVEEVPEPTLDELYAQAFAPPEDAVEDVVENATTEEVAEVEEVPAETELPQYTELVEGDIDLTNNLEVEAINYWGGGPKASWTKHPEQMTDDQKAVFSKHQAAFDKSRVTPEEPAPTHTKNEMSEAVADLARLIKGDPETKAKYMGEDKQPEPEVAVDDKMSRMFDALDSDDREAAVKIFNEIRNEDRERAVADAAKLASEAALQGVRDTQTQKEKEGWIRQVADDNKAMVEKYGSAYTQYSDKILRTLELTDAGIPNPLTGTMVRTVQEAYELARKTDSGGEQRVANVRPSPAITPPAGSGEGSAPDFTDSDYSGDTRSFMEKAYDRVLGI